MSLDPKSSIMVPEDRFGLYAIDVLDPDMVRFHITYLTTKKALQLNSLLLLLFLYLFFFLDVCASFLMFV